MAVLILAFAAFLRMSEVQSLRLENCKINRDFVRLTITKAKRRPDGFTATFPTNSICGKFFVRYLRKFKFTRKKTGFVFPMTPEKVDSSFATSNFQEKLQLIVKENNWSGRYGFHSCKLGATTAAIKAGMSTEEVRALARWRDASLVARYTRLEETAVCNLAGKICG